ncbi:hypothetical protein [Jannaschia seohaensis]|uniref:Lipopolysaccharide export system protein LptC n=1 Tax=Jannaschia seohaensis TaxID=475081 RepID=A0A2Y9C3M1_9RHOB|nr:hypothetical protein [Jannaschia seohaensis]PWJ21785.1 lipopolysaccharide export system protein LptC [Jannaschia seohaensis]SSA38063.1 lipopolysaccharide export system protein LptC [Jannaschia seohaensis]
MADSHTSLVRGARILLPMAALGLLSSLFLLPRTVNPDDAIPYAEVDVSMRARDQQLTAPRFAGVSSHGSDFALTAARALPDRADPSLMTAEAVALEVISPEAARITLRADRAEVDAAGRSLVLEGAVEIETSTGYSLTAPRLEGRLDVVDMRGTDVAGDGPIGTLRAGALHLTETGGVSRLVFTRGIELVYLPPER